jgi:hypothetical protein
VVLTAFVASVSVSACLFVSVSVSVDCLRHLFVTERRVAEEGTTNR